MTIEKKYIRFGLLGVMLYRVYFKYELSKHQSVLCQIPVCRVLLDAGCGEGLHSGGFMQKTDWLIGLDLSGDLKTYVKKYDCTGVVASLEALPFRVDSVDVAVLQDSLEHTSDPEGTMKQFSRIVRSRIVVVVPNFWNRFFDFNSTTKSNHKQHTNMFGWKRIFIQAGWEPHVSNAGFPVLNKSWLRRHLTFFGMGLILVGEHRKWTKSRDLTVA